MQKLYDTTRLWRNTLGARENDEHSSERETLRNSLKSMRANATVLVSLIPENCKGLTVHDITHLDALWDMADQLVGDNDFLNPLEALFLVLLFYCMILA